MERSADFVCSYASASLPLGISVQNGPHDLVTVKSLGVGVQVGGDGSPRAARARTDEGRGAT